VIPTRLLECGSCSSRVYNSMHVNFHFSNIFYPIFHLPQITTGPNSYFTCFATSFIHDMTFILHESWIGRRSKVFVQKTICTFFFFFHILFYGITCRVKKICSEKRKIKISSGGTMLIDTFFMRGNHFELKYWSLSFQLKGFSIYRKN
jgi:hypothetical protein